MAHGTCRNHQLPPPLSVYARTCRDAGLLVRDILEPVPGEKVLAERDYLREYLRAPAMIIFECVKLEAP